MAHFLFTLDEIASFHMLDNMVSLQPAILAKMQAAAVALRSPYNMDPRLYDNVIITSDIHSDLGKLHEMFKKINLVSTNIPADPRLNATTGPIFEIFHSEWIPERTLLIIVGDLVDGGREGTSVPDTKGNIELMLHAYLYNLRIKARLKNSEIRFTIGNHDYHTVIRPREADTSLYDRYVHLQAKRFFTNPNNLDAQNNRRNCLLPFYECCPYLFVSLGDEVGCIHGGMSGFTEDIEDYTPRIIEIQGRIDAANSFGGMTDADCRFIGYNEGPLWSRVFSLGRDEELCNDITTKYKLLVVGHCQMANIRGKGCTDNRMSPEIHNILTREPSYTRHACGGPHGCVVTRCRTNTGVPRVAFVDIGFSRAFGTTMNEVTRRAEVILLHHDTALRIDRRYYNNIIRLNTGLDGSPNEIVWQEAVAGGSKSRKNRKRLRRMRTKRHI